MKRLLLILFVLLLTLQINAQENTVLTVMIPSSYDSRLDRALESYQQAHPNVTIQTLDFPVDALGAFDRLDDPDAYLDTLKSLASQADVLLMDRYTFGIEATRAGYFLDLEPLISLEPELEDSIYPAMWQSFKWDNGTWAIPLYAGPLSLIYNTEAFDNAGITHPDESWSGDDYLSALNAVAAENHPAMFISELDIPLWLQTLSEMGSIRDTSGPGSPMLATPELADTLAAWGTAAQNDSLTTLPSDETVLQIQRGFNVPTGFEQAALRGNQIGLYAFGLAISSGTAHPEQAFDLASYLSASPEFVMTQSFAFPANRNIAQQHPDYETWGELFETALPQSVFDLYLVLAWRAAVFGGIDATEALENAEIYANQMLALAEARQSETIVVVAPEIIEPEPDEIVLNFGLYTGQSPEPLLRRWEDVADEFAESEQGLVQVILTHYPPTLEGFEQLETVTSDMDCLYSYTSADRSNNYLEGFLPLEPLMDADSTFDPADLLPGALEQVQVKGHTLALPVSVFPTVMYANERLFEEAGLHLPDSIATIEGFVTALEQLASLMGDQEPFYPAWTMWGGHLFPLMAAYGVQPLDFKQSPPVVNLTDPDTVSVIQQVLDLARAGLIYYQPTARNIQHSDRTNRPPALLTHGFYDAGPNPFIGGGDPYQLVLFPAGEAGQPIVVGYVTGIFISAESQQPELCYRFAREVTRHPELFNGLPAYRSVIDSPQTLAARGAQDAAFYQTYADVLTAPNTLLTQAGSGDYPQAMWWLQRAFDRYVLEGADLETELAQAEQFTREYIACVDKGEAPPIPGYPRCALEVDPSIVETFQSD